MQRCAGTLSQLALCQLAGAGAKGDDLQSDRFATQCQGLERWRGGGGAERIQSRGTIWLGPCEETVERFAMGEIEMIERFSLVNPSFEAPTGLEVQAHETMAVSLRYLGSPDQDGGPLLLLAGFEQ